MAVGGGRVMDTAKIAGLRAGLPVIAVPTMLSTDAFLTTAAAQRQNGYVTYLQTGAAEQVVIDYDLIAKAPPWRNAMGTADVLSMLTASWDWANTPGGGGDDAVIARGNEICSRLLDAEDAIAAGSRDGLEALLQGLIAEVGLCSEAGSDRVEEGSEHYFAYAFELHAPGWMHGALVGLGIVLAAALQGKPADRVLPFLHSTGVTGPWSSVSEEQVARTLLGMKDYVRRAGLPWSIWEAAGLTERQASNLARDALKGGLP